MNSAFFIWTLTALVGSLVTFTYNNQQTCVRDAEQQTLGIQGNKTELLGRILVLAAALKTSSNSVEFQQMMRLARGGRSDLKGKTVADLTSDLVNAMRSADPSPITRTSVAEMFGRSHITPEDVALAALFLTNPSDETNDVVLQRAKPLAEKLASLYDDLTALDEQWVAVPHCTLWGSIQALWTGKRPTIAFEAKHQPPNPYFKTGTLGDALKMMDPSKSTDSEQK